VRGKAQRGKVQGEGTEDEVKVGEGTNGEGIEREVTEGTFS
jgi:hypothetical protein